MNECEAVHKLIAELVSEIRRIRLEPLPEPPEWVQEMEALMPLTDDELNAAIDFIVAKYKLQP